MLKTRVVTAMAMLAVFLFSLLFSPFFFALFMAGVIAFAFWEWGGFLKLSFEKRGMWAWAAFFCCALFSVYFENVLLLKTLPSYLFVILSLNALFWCLVAPVWLKEKWHLQKLGEKGGVFLGFFILFPLWLSIVQLRHFGVGALFFAMAIVWIADSLAYFVGRKWGKNKLAPSISPGKTKEGALGGMFGVMAYFACFAFLKQSADFSIVPFILALFFGGVFAALSILGDLLESLFKRQAGIKDSGIFLPGHGGFLDRFDSLAAVLPSFWLMFLFFYF